MKDAQSKDRTVFENQFFILEQGDSCLVPGYLILRVKGGATSLGQLPPETAHAVGAMLSRAVRAIEDAVAPERVYCLSFREIDSRLHVHLFPRTRALLEAYWDAAGTSGEPVNEPKLFEWARTAIVPGRPVPASLAASDDICAALRRALDR